MQRIDPNPLMTRAVVARRLLDSPLRVIDVGARGGISAELEVFDQLLDVTGFEPDAAEAERLNAESDRRQRFLPVALGRERHRRPLFIARFAAGSSFYATRELFDGTVGAQNVEVVGRTEVEVVPLDDLDLAPADVIKIDAELAELDIIAGGRATIQTAIAVELEVHFPKRPVGAGCFADVDQAMRELGFELYDLDTFRVARAGTKVVPAVPLYDYRDDSGRPIPGPTVEGQTVTGDALYMRRDPTRLLKLACLQELHRLRDCAEMTLAQLGGELESELRPLLRRPDDDDGIRGEDGRLYGPNYYVFEELWRERRHR